VGERRKKDIDMSSGEGERRRSEGRQGSSSYGSTSFDAMRYPGRSHGEHHERRNEDGGRDLSHLSTEAANAYLRSPQGIQYAMRYPGRSHGEHHERRNDIQRPSQSDSNERAAAILSEYSEFGQNLPEGEYLAMMNDMQHTLAGRENQIQGREWRDEGGNVRTQSAQDRRREVRAMITQMERRLSSGE
jgi:hypothetical protein